MIDEKILRNNIISVRISNNQLKTLKNMAKSEDRSVSNFIYKTIKEVLNLDE